MGWEGAGPLLRGVVEVDGRVCAKDVHDALLQCIHLIRERRVVHVLEADEEACALGELLAHLLARRDIPRVLVVLDLKRG